MLFSLLHLLFFACGGSSMQEQSSEDKPQPNVVIIFTDDQGYADVGVFGAKGYQTPNLDKMAEEGTTYTNFHVAHAVCFCLTGCPADRLLF